MAAASISSRRGCFAFFPVCFVRVRGARYESRYGQSRALFKYPDAVYVILATYIGARYTPTQIWRLLRRYIEEGKGAEIRRQNSEIFQPVFFCLLLRCRLFLFRWMLCPIWAPARVYRAVSPTDRAIPRYRPQRLPPLFFRDFCIYSLQSTLCARWLWLSALKRQGRAHHL